MSFGGSQGVNPGIGLRILSDDQEDEVAATLGLDWMFGSQSLRGAFGIAYVMDGSYVDLTGGYDFSSGGFDVGLGIGAMDSESRSAAAPTTTTTTTTATTTTSAPAATTTTDPSVSTTTTTTTTMPSTSTGTTTSPDPIVF